MRKIYHTSRSKIKEFHRCPRACYYQYHLDGTGIVSANSPIPLVVGGSVHIGLEALIRGEGPDVACEKALADYSARCTERPLEITEFEDSYYVYNEQRALLEALILAFYYRGLTSFLEEYEVLETEKETPLELFAEGVLETKADGLLRKRSTGELYILSWKTAKAYDKRKQKENETDDQGLSEWAALTQRLLNIASLSTPEGKPLWWYSGPEIPLKIAGVQMVYLIKGTRTDYPSGSGKPVQNSFLVRPWIKEGFSSPQFAWSWNWQDEVSNRTLGKSYRRVNIWELMSIKEWIELLAAGGIQPEAGDALSSVVIMPPPYIRDQIEIEDWVEQASYQEESIARNLADMEVNRAEDDIRGDRHTQLNAYFPQHRRSCEYPTACTYKKLCFTPLTPEDALSSGLFVRRTPHHEGERSNSEDE